MYENPQAEFIFSTRFNHTQFFLYLLAICALNILLPVTEKKNLAEAAQFYLSARVCVYALKELLKCLLLNINFDFTKFRTRALNVKKLN